MQNENSYTVGQWCDRWFHDNQSTWNSSTVGGYRNLIYRHILLGIGNIPLTELTEDTVTSFYDSLRNQGLSARSVWCVHLLLRRCMDGAARPNNEERAASGGRSPGKSSGILIGCFSPRGDDDHGTQAAWGAV